MINEFITKLWLNPSFKADLFNKVFARLYFFVLFHLNFIKRFPVHDSAKHLLILRGERVINERFFLDPICFLSEQHLFKLMDPHFGDHSPVSCMREEHRALWDLVLRLQEGLRQGDIPATVRAGTEAVALLRDHIAKENHVLYPMAERMLSPEDFAKLSEAFQEA